MSVKTLSWEEARTNLYDVMDEVSASEVKVVIECQSKPTVVVISYKAFQCVQKERERRRRHPSKIRAEMVAGHFYTWEQVEADLKERGLLSL